MKHDAILLKQWITIELLCPLGEKHARRLDMNEAIEHHGFALAWKSGTGKQITKWAEEFVAKHYGRETRVLSISIQNDWDIHPVRD